MNKEQRGKAMKKKLTRRQAEELIEIKYSHITGRGSGYVWPLCGDLPFELRLDFQKWWVKANTERCFYMFEYFNGAFEQEETTILRLITLHHFIQETYK
jgi:hypothetical protein